ncbi:glycosyltransferase [Winogradskyella maritima]|uniref:Glycosyltransferase n=1 Tax=Winogradskyella maritima TaxID=1517766 RepID=A0ABV8AKH8_9FLAO|nr:glycosyltransferase [Winogradskyella maritima]
MNILLFGEYSGFFNHLKSGLIELGHTVTLAAREDGFKAYATDINLEDKRRNNTTWLLFRKAIHKIFNYDISGLKVYQNFKRNRHRFTNFDVVFLINPFPLQTHPKLEKNILQFLFKNNSKVFLSACGDDYQYNNYLKTNDLKYSILDPYFEDSNKRKFFRDSLKYLKSSQKLLHDYVISNCAGIIAANMDYAMAYANTPRYLGYVPFPFKMNLDEQEIVEAEKLTIFHGINSFNYYKKGNHIFEEALAIIKNKYGEQIKVIETHDLPYQEYIEATKSADILLDQVYSYSQGYNALEAMSQGKIVFSGAEDRWLAYFNIEKDSVVINAEPNVDYLVEKLEGLIKDRELRQRIKLSAKRFVETEHNHKKQAEAYIKIWTA